LQSTSTLVIGIVLAMFYSWKVTLVSLAMVPLVFAGVFLEARFTLGHGLQEKAAVEAATKVMPTRLNIEFFCVFINGL
jgi:ABC-type bacteriocin/lantibiotic exporter with double-glycine peptidase domain